MRLVPASLTHCGPLALNMRAHDKRECQALGRSPKEALRLSIRTSLHALTAVDDHGPLAMFGVCPIGLLSGKGTPWFLGTDRVFNYGAEMLRIGSKVIAWWLDIFDELDNIVSAENDKAIRLLRRWGAVVGSEQVMHGGLAFVPFRFSAAIQGHSLAA